MAAVPAVPAGPPPDPLDSCLSICGMPGNIITLFKAAHRINTLQDLSPLREGHVVQMVKMYNTNRAQDRKIGFLEELRIKALVFWVRDHRIRGIAVNHLNWTINVMNDTMDQQLAAEQLAKTDTATSITLGKIETGMAWPSWLTQLRAKCETIPSSHGPGYTIGYLVKANRQPGWVPATAHERLMYSMPLTGPQFEVDEKVLFSLLQGACIGTSAHAWIKTYESSQQGYASFQALYSQFEGTGANHMRAQLATQTLSMGDKGVKYRGNERTFKFAKYAAILQDNRETYESIRGPMADATMTQRLLDGMLIPTNTIMTVAMEKVREDYMDDFLGAVNHLTTKVAIALGGPGSSRRAQEMKSGKGRGGRGRGGRGRGGRGRGRGHQGRGYGGHQGATFNNIDCSNASRAFTDTEWNAIGREGQDYVRNQREEAKKKRFGDSYDPNFASKRHINEVNTDEVPSQDSKVPRTEKGAKNGTAFGRRSGTPP